MGQFKLFGRLRTLGTSAERQKRRQRIPRRRSLSFEALETRRLLSGTPFNYSAMNADPLQLVVVGSTLELRDQKTNAIVQSAVLASTSSVTINGYAGGGQTFDVDFSGGAFNIPITINSNGTPDQLLIDDHADTAAGVAYSIGSSTVAVDATTICYGSSFVNGMIVDTGSGIGDQVTINSVNPASPLTLNTSAAGAESVSIGGSTAGSLGSFVGYLTLNTHASDSLTFLDNASSALSSYSITATGLIFNGRIIPYTTAASIKLATSSYAGEAVFVTSLPTATSYVSLVPTAGHISMIVSPSALASSTPRTIDAGSSAPAGSGDLMTVDDSTDPTSGVFYTVTATFVQAGNTAVVYGSSASGGLVINTGKGSGDEVIVDSTSAAVSVAVNTSGASATSIFVGGLVTGSLANIAGPLTLLTHAVDSIVFNDNATTSVVNYQLMSSYLLWNSSIIGYISPGSITVATSRATGDRLFVTSLPASTTFVTLAPAGTNTSFIVSPDALHATRIIDAASKVPAGSSTSVTVDDSTNTASVVYTVINSGVQLSGGALVEYGAGDTGGLVINTGRGINDIVNVVQTLAQVPVAINTSGAYRTTIYVGGANSNLLLGTLAAIAGPLTLQTNPLDAVVFLDDASSASATYTIYSNYLVFNSQIIGYRSLVAIELFTSTAKDTVNVCSLPAALTSLALHLDNSAASPGTVVTLKSGAFTTALQRTVDASSFIPAGAGDYLTVDDSADTVAGMSYNLIAHVISISQGGPGYTSVLYSSNYQAVALLTGSGKNDSVTIAATSAPMNVTTSAAGCTTIDVGSGNLGNIAPGLTIQSQGIHDSLTFDDSANSTGTTYDIQGNQLTRGSLTIGFTVAAKAFTVLVGTGMNSVTVENLPSAETLALTINKTDSYTKLASALGTVVLAKRP
ncbi:MAG TPA: hypothetical protein VHZ24_00170 [Pirellulales bacterium]|jgi:hypothetical protein|nr:hypothetical protein [Pirellulales bacterium]